VTRMRPLKRFQSEAGFTWIEIVILVALLGILSALIYPRFQQMQETGREAATKSNIGAIKSAISIYYGDHEGVWPTTLDVNDHTLGFGFGNYLDAMPKVKATHPVDPAKNPEGGTVAYKAFSDEPSLAAPGSTGHGWRYECETGRIWVNSSDTDSQGASYTTYGYE
jgi:type II secretory pathway pseudopilin PulG